MSATIFGKEGWTPERIGDLTNQTFLITGANTGAGFEAARLLLEKNAKVVMLNRNSKKSEDAMTILKDEFGAQVDVSFIKMDLANLESVRKAALTINNKISKIDALLCNAAVAQLPKQTFTADGFESHLGINHYGHFLLCGLLFDKIESSKGRIVVVASEGYKMGIKTIQFEDMNWNKNYHPNKTYCHSKLAQMMFAYELQDKIKAARKNVNVYVCHPGASATTLIKNSGGLKDRIIFGLMSLTPLVQSARKGAYPEVMCATEEERLLNLKGYYGPTGRMQWTGPVGECTLESHARDKAVMKQLWQVSEKATNFKWDLKS
ncbi:SDR family oxidoreductase [uncultured Dokdonia sp.]|uniref:SDR family oxidoreductase n=1 Tax=uncultured Dokdonia sp. TaxID=575653 RepID=UPI0030EBC8D8|tara:strand:- start:238545 stop:239504 length:960 start_codon:yes stop_codon:yes gene_type:complete